ncbi:sperm-associated antigen 4 protein-like isoform X2 [Vidua chalybeata]|uniref:sperm-associated antigen 4 protein-like isoform X2 n=1 Tax=Vidua chalybeata TaxID=81927 RepID=UPI0023A881B5|nr:sperm-associated antigen 4 protein-like isoform X2 [Vidua chalybeata]
MSWEKMVQLKKSFIVFIVLLSVALGSRQGALGVCCKPHSRLPGDVNCQCFLQDCPVRTVTVDKGICGEAAMCISSRTENLLEPPLTHKELPRPMTAKRVVSAGFYPSSGLPAFLILFSKCFPRKLLGFQRASGPGCHQVASMSLPDCHHSAAHPQRCLSKWAIISAPRDIAILGVDADREEETLLGVFTYNVEKNPTQTFPRKNMLLPRAFSQVKLFVKSNWGNPWCTCIYQVKVHGKMENQKASNQGQDK